MIAGANPIVLESVFEKSNRESHGSTRISHLQSSQPPFQGPTQSYRDFYQYRWFRKLILLMYGLSLAFAGALLYMLPASGGANQLQTDIVGYVVTYLQFLALDVTVVVLFINGSMFIKNKDLPLLFRRNMSRPQQRTLLRCVELCHSHAGRLLWLAFHINLIVHGFFFEWSKISEMSNFCGQFLVAQEEITIAFQLSTVF